MITYKEQIKRDNDSLREQERLYKPTITIFRDTNLRKFKNRKQQIKINYILLIAFIISCIALSYLIGDLALHLK